MRSHYCHKLASMVRQLASSVRKPRRGKPKSRLRFEALEAREVFSAGGLDPTFNFGFGKASTDFDTSSEMIRDMVFQPDGKIVAVGTTNAGGGSNNFALARYNPDGTLDGTFGGMGGLGAGRVATDFAFSQDHAYQAAVLSDGDILVAGTSQYIDDDSPAAGLAFARYNADGTLDDAFGTLGRVKEVENIDFGHSLDGLFVAGNKFLVFSRGSTPMLARYNLSDGSIDETFGVGGRILLNLPISVHAAALHNDGIVLGGKDPVTDDMAFVRLHLDGTLDANFGTGGVAIVAPPWAYGYATSIAVQNDGAIVATGKGYAGSEHFVAVARLLADGTVDSSFNIDGVYQLPVSGAGGGGDLRDVALAPGGAILAAGTLGETIEGRDFAVIRLGPDGAPDEAFGPGGLVTIDFAGDRDEGTKVLSYANGKILLGGNVADPASSGYDFGLTRLFGVNTPEFDPEIGGLTDPGGEGGAFSRPDVLTGGEDGDDRVIEDYRVEFGEADEPEVTPLRRDYASALHDAAILSLLAEDGDAAGKFNLQIMF